MLDLHVKKLYSKLPSSPGIYIMKNARGKVLYVGKAVNLRRRVSSYFLRPHDRRIAQLVSEIRRVDHEKTPSALEALILESALIKKFDPPYNIREKDDKSFLYIEITKERYPRVLLVRGKSRVEGERYGPFVSAHAVREALRILRKIFPWNIHPEDKIGRIRACFDYQIGLCPGTCFKEVSRKEYIETVKNLKLFLMGKRGQVVKNMERAMKKASLELRFEEATKIRGRLFALRHIQDTALIENDELQPNNLHPSSFNLHSSTPRIEGYDISNISGTDAVGVMVVFEGDTAKKSDYKKFLIRTVKGPNDVAMLREVINRRFGKIHSGSGWTFPSLLLIDGGKPQVNAVLDELKKLKISLPVIGIAKGPTRKKVEVIGEMPEWITLKTLVAVRDESHRFAVSFHRARRSVRMRG